MVLVYMLFALDEASLIRFPVFAGPLMCNVGRQKTSQKEVLLKAIEKKSFFNPNRIRNFADALII